MNVEGEKERGIESSPGYFNGFTWYDGPGIGKKCIWETPLPFL